MNASPQSLRILVVDDDPVMRRLAKVALRGIGTVVEASDGAEALLLLFDGPPDLIVSDIMMPNIDGLELTRNLKADPRLRRIPVILITAKGMPRDIVDGINAGARSYLTKPFTPDELTRKAKKALGL